MAKLNYAFFCDYSLISTGGLPSFISIFSGVKSEKLPASRSITIIANLVVEKGDSQSMKLVIVVKSPKGKEIGKAETNALQVDENTRELGYITLMKGLIFEEIGLYEFGIFLEGKKLGSTTLLVERNG